MAFVVDGVMLESSVPPIAVAVAVAEMTRVGRTARHEAERGSTRMLHADGAARARAMVGASADKTPVAAADGRGTRPWQLRMQVIGPAGGRGEKQ